MINFIRKHYGGYKWYHWVGGVAIAAVFMLFIGGEDGPSCSVPIRGELSPKKLATCTFEAQARSYSPTKVRTIKLDSTNKLCHYSERDINQDSLSYSEKVSLITVEKQRSGYDGKNQLIYRCDFKKFNNSYFVYNEGDFSIVEVDGDPNGGVWVRKR